MVDILEMPYSEKLASTLDYQRLVEGFTFKLVNSKLGKEKSDELHALWEKESVPIPDGASDKDKYEVAHRNLLQNWVTAHDFMALHKGEEGSRDFMVAAISAWEGKHASSALKLRIVGGVSRKAAFRALAKQLAYQLQMFSPFTVTELSDDRMVLNVAPCKIMDVRSRNDFCLMACQNIIPRWLEKQFKVQMTPDHQGTNCIMTFTPF